MQLVIRRYRPSDKDAVLVLFSDGILEHIGPSFRNAMTQPLYLVITLGLSAVGHHLGGGALLCALLLAGAWVALVYYCCYELYDSFVRERLRTDMLDIPGCYLSQPDNCFWVAEAEVDGRSEVMGMVAVVAKQSAGEGTGERYGELFRMIISSSCRRMGLGSRLAQTVIDFCKEHGFSKVVLETSSTQTAAVALYKKMGFTLVLTHAQTHAPDWITKLSGVHILKMEKQIQG
ncbi:N-acetyltransferase 8-like 2 [Osmerus mordax]|uniref:N-acetyltransferase 8-like 2 n=1 Tax=Osmerus mordax TaxID=8014 RepID=UPI0035101459